MGSRSTNIGLERSVPSLASSIFLPARHLQDVAMDEAGRIKVVRVLKGNGKVVADRLHFLGYVSNARPR